MKVLTLRSPETIGFSSSLIIHLAAALSFLAVAGFTVGHKELITVVLDNQPFIMGGDGKEGSPAPKSAGKSTQKADRPKPAEKRTASSIPAPSTVSEVTAKEVRPAAFAPVTSDVTPVTANTVSSVGSMKTGSGAGSSMEETSATAAAPGRGGIGTGSGRGAGGTGVGEASRTAYLKEHFCFIREAIMKNLVYPSVARKMGWKGYLTVSFVICEGGNVEKLRIVKSSGYKILDENALNTIKGIQPFPRPPVRAEIVIPIEYRIG